MPQLTETPKASQSFKANPTENPLSELGIAFYAKFASLAVFQYHSNPFLVFICASIQLGETKVHLFLCNFSSTLVHEPICHYYVYHAKTNQLRIARVLDRLTFTIKCLVNHYIPMMVPIMVHPGSFIIRCFPVRVSITCIGTIFFPFRGFRNKLLPKIGRRQIVQQSLQFFLQLQFYHKQKDFALFKVFQYLLLL